MQNQNKPTSRWLYMLVMVSLLLSTNTYALVVTVVDPDGTPVSGFRYMLEEDTSHEVTPGVSIPNNLSLSIHRSYAPVVVKTDGTPATGHIAGSNAEISVSNGNRYILSVLPDSGFSNTSKHVYKDQDKITIVVYPLPLPTAQISVLVFKDDSPINNIPDLPREAGLAGFSIILHDAADKLVADTFGNPLGTSYQRDTNGNVVLDADGNPVVLLAGDGTISSDAKGEALIKNLAPGKYGVQVIPPSGQNWVQTNTIEGTHTIDAWVRAGESANFGQFGPPNKHVFFGFVQAFNNLPAAATSTSVSGRVVNAHSSTPPDFTFNNGHPLPGCWVGLNEMGSRKGVIAQPCNDDSTFTLDGVPAGEYQLAIWDKHLDNIFTIQGITVPADGTPLSLGDISVFRWFGYLQNYVFYDHNQNGFRDCYLSDNTTLSSNPEDCDNLLVDDVGIPEQNVNLRFRDGSIYQAYPTDTTGFVPFDEVFPFLRYLIAEVDFARLKATGATIVADGGGAVLPDQGWDYPTFDVLAPQAQCESRSLLGDCINPIINPNTGNHFSRTVVGPVLTLAPQTYLGLTNVIHWGKANYSGRDNGGISGIIYYATTRAEDDPQYAAGEEWEPGIPRVQVALYQDNNLDNIIDDVNGDGNVTLADVDNYPFGNFPAVEDIDHNGNKQFEAGDAVQITTADSWDDNLPTGCQAPPFFSNGGQAQDCFESLRTFNQVSDGVFDGGYAFNTMHPGGVDSGSIEQPIQPGQYIVEAYTPPGYKHVKEEDRNVDFGEPIVVAPNLLPPACVGDPHLVPAELTLFPGVATPSAGQTKPLCDRKTIRLSGGKNAAVDFFMFTDVPKAARVVGLLLNDFANVFDPTHPSFGEKAAPPWMPISIQDHTGREIARIYSDEFGTYNAMIPSTYTVNVPSPTGVSPNMLRLCLNHPGPIPFPGDPKILITDPRFDPKFSQICYTADFWPGKTTYLDTPILPAAATAGRTDYPLDCALSDVTPGIYSVSGPNGGPYVASAGQTITITSENWNGLTPVANPAYKAGTGTPLTVLRDYGFGNIPGNVTIGGVPLNGVNWSDVQITATIPAGVTTGELVVTRGDSGKSSTEGVTVTVGGPAPTQVALGGSIQAAIDAAAPGDLIMVPPGTYNELVIMWKSVKLQGWGANSTIINAAKSTPDMLLNWQARIANLTATAMVDLIPGQTGLSNLEEGPGITVLAKNGVFNLNPARIDGFTVKNATNGGAIFVNGYAANLEISNNLLLENQGTYGGGLRVGHPFVQPGGNFIYSDAVNDDLNIHHNRIVSNGARSQAGGGIALYTGSDRYRVTNNFICGNFSAQDGGGIGHIGLSDQAVIANNTIVFNQVFQQTAGAGGAGGGLFISGGAPLGTDTLTPGAGSITIDGNIIQANQAGADDGGGIMLRYINGQDTAGVQNSWYTVNVFNNIVTNNISALAGAITLQDALRVNIINNTIADNDSTASSAAAFSTGPSVSTPQPAGVVTRSHTTALAGAIGGSGLAAYSDPQLVNNIIWHNRSFYWNVALNGGQGGLVPDIAAGDAPVYLDLAVIGIAGNLNPMSSVLTDTAGYDASNNANDPQFVAQYNNGGPSHLLATGNDASIVTIPAFDEGGNFLDMNIGPLTLTNPVTGALFGDYHLMTTSPSINSADAGIVISFPALTTDIDNQTRPGGGGVDIGADEADGIPAP